MTRRTAFVFTLLAMPLAAQSSSFTLLTPANATAIAGSQSQTVGVPTGPLTSAGSVFASRSAANGSLSMAAVDWNLVVLPYRLDLAMHTTAYVQGQAPDRAAFTGGDFRWTLTHPTPVTVAVELTRGAIIGSGLVYAVDVGDDGSVELTDQSAAATVTLQLTLGPSPLPIRIHNDASLVGPGNLDALMRIAVVAVAGTQLTPTILGCDPAQELRVLPQFDGDLRFVGIGPLFGGSPCVAVCGLAVQPIVLAPPQPFPCLLLPSPDLLVPLFQGPFVLPTAPAVRPFRFFAQAVALHANALLTTNGIQIDLF